MLVKCRGQQFAAVYWVSFDIDRLLTLNLFLNHVARRLPALYQFNVGPVICKTPWFSSVECLRPLFCTVPWWEERVIQKHQIWNQRKQKRVKLYHMRNWPGNLTKLNPKVICEKLPFWSASNFTWKKSKFHCTQIHHLPLEKIHNSHDYQGFFTVPTVAQYLSPARAYIPKQLHSTDFLTLLAFWTYANLASRAYFGV